MSTAVSSGTLKPNQPFTPPLRHRLIQELRESQETHGFLTTSEMERIARELELHLSDVHAVASFYPHFRLKPQAKIEVRICRDMVCHMHGAPGVHRALEHKFKSNSRQDVSICGVSCLGRCDHAPACVINDRYYDGLSEAQAVKTVEETLAGKPPEETYHAPETNSWFTDLYGARESYSTARKILQSSNREPLLEELFLNLKSADLRGMGGAGFRTWMKWSRVKRWQNTPIPKFIVCNADESEPGTIKDREILIHTPQLVIEGMILAGLYVGAERGYFYIRHEYHEQARCVDEEIKKCRELGLLGRDGAFDIELFVSPGGYICGEESALLEAIEGKRAEPRNKPTPLLPDEGLWNFPTVINNVETFAMAAVIAANGATWFNNHGGVKYHDKKGDHTAAGMKFVAVSGDVQRPGVHLAPLGTTYGQMIYDLAGGPKDQHRLIAFAPSGPSGGILPIFDESDGSNQFLDIKGYWENLLDVGSMFGSAAIVAFDERRCMLDIALNAVRFYRNESCGKCVPCRIGSQKMVDILERWTGEGKLTPREIREGLKKDDEEKLAKELFVVLAKGSICGLGQIVPAPVDSILRHFGDLVEEHIHDRHCRAGVCFGGKS